MEKALVNKSYLNEKAKTLAPNEEIKTLVKKPELKAEQDKIVELQAFDSSYLKVILKMMELKTI